MAFDSHSEQERDQELDKKGSRAKKGAARGRKGPDKQEAVIEPKVLKQRMPELVKLKKAADLAGVVLSDAIKVAAEKSGFLASVVRKAVVASAGEDFEAKNREVEQLQLAFEAVA